MSSLFAGREEDHLTLAQNNSGSQNNSRSQNISASVSLHLFKRQNTDSDTLVVSSIRVSNNTGFADKKLCSQRIQELLKEWESSAEPQKMNIREVSECYQVEQLQFLCSIFEKFDKENPFDSERKLENFLDCSKINDRKDRINYDKLCKCREDYLIRLQVYKDTVETCRQTHCRLAVFSKILDAEKLRAVTLDEELEQNDIIASDILTTLPAQHAFTPDIKPNEIQNKIRSQHNVVLEKCGDILSSAREMGDQILGYAEDVVSKFRSTSEACSRLNAYEKQWKQAIGQFVSDDGLEYRYKLNLDLQECLTLSLEDQEKCLKSYSRRFERLTEELSRNEQGILLKWKLFLDEACEVAKPDSTYSSDILEFLARCQQFVVEKQILISELQRTSQNDETNEFLSNNLEDSERNRESFEIVCKSLEVLSSYLSTLERRAMAYTRTVQEFASCQLKLKAEFTIFEQRRNELHDLRDIVQKILLVDFQVRKMNISKLNDIFGVLTSVRDRCKEVTSEVCTQTSEVHTRSEHLQTTYQDLEPVLDSRCSDLLQKWNADEIKNGILARMFQTFEGNKHFIY